MWAHGRQEQAALRRHAGRCECRLEIVPIQLATGFFAKHDPEASPESRQRAMLSLLVHANSPRDLLNQTTPTQNAPYRLRLHRTVGVRRQTPSEG